MKLDKCFFGTEENIYLCFAYVNPEGSQHRTELDTLDMIKKDLARYNNLGRCILMADLNGYTNILPDYNTFDDNTRGLPLPEHYTSDTHLSRRNMDQ